MEDQNDLTEARIKAVVDKFEAEILGMRRALELAQQWPTELDKRIGQIRELLDVRFDAVENIIAERDRLYNERSELLQRLYQKQHDDNVQMRLQQHAASQEAIAKAEASMRQELVNAEELNRSNQQSLSARIDGIKEGVAALENRGKGAAQLWGFIVGGASLVIFVLGSLAMMQS